MDSLTILKIGGSVITDKHSETPKVNIENLSRLAEEISYYKKPLILIHGAGSYGHQIVKRTGINNGITKDSQLVDFAETQRLQNELNSIVCSELIKKGTPAIPIQASSSALMDNGRLISMDSETIRNLVEMKMVPVLYGVPAYDKSQLCSILSGDQIAPYLALKLKASRIIHGTNVDGVFTADPYKNPGAELILEITKSNLNEVMKMLSGSSAVDVTGGMCGKVSELLSLADSGIESILVNAEKEDRVKKALSGDNVVCTVVK